MSTEPIRFDNGAAYARYMGVWSQLVGQAFLDWLAPQASQRWLDVGCGNGAFTELIVARCSPAEVAGVDPSAGQLAFARAQPSLSRVTFVQADAMALPFPDNRFDITVMPLVIFFVPEPARGVAEMARVTAPGGYVTAYGWDMAGGGFPYSAVREELCDMGFATPEPPSKDASQPEVMRTLWEQAGLVDLQSRTFTVQRTFASFEDYWATVNGGPSTSSSLKSLQPADVAHLQSRLRDRLPPDAQGRITYAARANAIRGRVPG